jgi:peptide/nickel transport system permease protein
MRAYAVKRVGLFFPSLILISLVVFTILRVVPGDPAVMMLSGGGEEGEEYTQEALANLRAELGTDRPIYVQYADWVWKMLRLDFGASLFFDNPVSEHIEQRLPVTLQLGLMAAFLAVIVAVPLGVYSALRQDTIADYIARTITILGIAVPNFWVAIMMIFFLVLWFGYLPPLGFVNFWDDPSANLQQLIFPAIALGTSNTAFIARITRSAMLEVLREDYIRTARAKGLREAVVIFRHALRNSLLPVLTVVGHEVGGIISGTVVIEVVFLVPGMGRLLITSIVNRDFAMIQGVVIMIAVFVLSINLIADLLYAWLNPRIRYS